MDITIEGFHSWMWKGLSFLLPFLFAGYFFQAYNSYVLYKLSRVADAPWQVSFLSLLFLTLFVGNTFTTLVVVPQKLRGKIKESYRLKSVSWAMKIRQQIKVQNDFRCPSSNSWQFSHLSWQGEKAEKIRLSESLDDAHFEGETSKNK